MNKQTQNKPRVGGKAKGAGVVSLMAAIALILGSTLDLEGGYVNHPSDPGGETNHGVIKSTARSAGYTGSMRALKRECDYPIKVAPEFESLLGDALESVRKDSDGSTKCAEQILFEGYIQKPNYVPLIVIDPVVAGEVIDTAVNMGPRRPSRYFQRAVNKHCGTRLKADGKIGRLTIGAWRDCRANLGPRVCRSMLATLDAQQAAEYRRLGRTKWGKKFLRGWLAHRIGNVDPRRCGERVG